VRRARESAQGLGGCNSDLVRRLRAAAQKYKGSLTASRGVAMTDNESGEPRGTSASPSEHASPAIVNKPLSSHGWLRKNRLGGSAINGQAWPILSQHAGGRLRSAHVKASWMPAAEERGRVLGRQAFEKPRGRKPRAGVARWWRAPGLIYGDLRSAPEGMA
jgi:hypothetical protein